MDIERFMQGYKAAWEARDKAMFAALFQPDGLYHNTPFACHRGHRLGLLRGHLTFRSVTVARSAMEH